MGWPVVTVTSGGIAVTDVSGTNSIGVPVEEAANGFGTAVTYVASGGIGVLGRAGTGVAAPNAPVLSLNSAVAGLMSFVWDIDTTVAAGDTLNRQVATDIGFSTVIDSTSHLITSGEADPVTGGTITASQYQAPANGTYYIRGSVTSAATSKTSAWSNILTVVVSDMSSAYGLLWGTDNILWSTDHMIWS